MSKEFAETKLDSVVELGQADQEEEQTRCAQRDSIRA